MNLARFDLVSLRLLVAVVDAGSLTGGAKRHSQGGIGVSSNHKPRRTPIAAAFSGYRSESRAAYRSNTQIMPLVTWCIPTSI